MKIKNFKADDVLNIFNILLLILTLIFLKNIFLFIFEILNSSQYFEPAENENLVLTYFLSINNKITFFELIKNGIFPPYPDFLHRTISLISGNFLFYGRLVSIISFFLIISTISLYSLYLNRSLTLFLLITLLLFGNEDHILYFLIFRPDSLFILLGLLSASLSLFSKKQKDKNTSKLLIFICGIFCFLSCITKQSGIIFVALNLIIIFFENEVIKNFKKILLNIIIFLISINLSYFFYKNYINNNIDLYFFSGYKLYSEINVDHFKGSLILFYQKGYAFTFFSAIYLVFFNSKSQDTKYFILKFILIFISLFTLRLFFNQGAINNNYMLINITSLIIIIFLFNELNKKKKLILLIFLLFNFFFYYSYKKKFFNINNFNIIENDITQSELYKLINNKKKILTDRLDNYLIFSNKNIFYESSVLTPIFTETTPAVKLNKNLQQHLVNLQLNIKRNLINREFEFIFLGISKNGFVKIFPEINDYYKIIKIEKIKQGNFEFTVELYAPIVQ
jgi:hypothetical protein